MPAMDEGAFVLDYLAASGTPLDQTEKMARDVEKAAEANFEAGRSDADAPPAAKIVRINAEIELLRMKKRANTEK